jgi:Flp pilus assembly pilin Flp
MIDWTRRKLTALMDRSRPEEGQGLAEYALILGLVAGACLLALTALGSALAGSPGFTSLPGAL